MGYYDSTPEQDKRNAWLSFMAAVLVAVVLIAVVGAFVHNNHIDRPSEWAELCSSAADVTECIVEVKRQ